jgi:hypothetical protein
MVPLWYRFGTFFHSDERKILVHLCTISRSKNGAFLKHQKRDALAGLLSGAVAAGAQS